MRNAAEMEVNVVLRGKSKERTSPLAEIVDLRQGSCASGMAPAPKLRRSCQTLQKTTQRVHTPCCPSANSPSPFCDLMDLPTTTWGRYCVWLRSPR